MLTVRRRLNLRFILKDLDSDESELRFIIKNILDFAENAS